MARKKNTKKRRSGLLGALVLLILLGVMAYKLVEVYGDLSVGKEREARLRTQKEQKQEEVNSLKDALSHADDPDYILGLARDRLGLVEDGERIFPGREQLSIPISTPKGVNREVYGTGGWDDHQRESHRNSPNSAAS